MFFSPYPFSHLLLIAAVALLLNLVFGGPKDLYASVRKLHPLYLWELLALYLVGKMNRYRRSDNTRKMRGGWLVFITLLICWGLGSGLQQLFTATGVWFEILLLALMLSARQRLDETIQIEKLLKHTPGQVDAVVLPAKLVRRQLRSYDHATVLRGNIEALAVGLGEGVVAPIFYYALFGWYGVTFVMFITILDAHIGYKNSQYENFGAVAAKAHTFLQMIPARIAGLLIALSAFFAPACSGMRAFRIMIQQSGRVASLNAGWPIAAMSGALGIVLGGPRALYGSFIADQWIGEGKSQIDVNSSVATRWLFCVIIFVLVMILLLLGAMV